jgi:hypothetical protein
MSDFIDDDLIDERTGEEPLDPTLAALARDYNAPPITPREAIWAGIERGRERAATVVTPLPIRRRMTRWIPIAAGIAALLALAFAFGRFSTQGAAPAIADRAADSTVADTSGGPAPAPVLATDAADAADPADPADAAEEEVLESPAPGGSRRAPRSRTPLGDSPAMQLVSGEPSGSPEPGLAANERDAAPDAFDIVAARHLSRSEVFLTLFRDALRGQEPAAELSPATARQLLVRNRLLLDSPAAQDPRMRRLLEDLELVLAQIAQLPAEDRAEDTELITDGLEAGDVLTRLRSATSTGVAATLRQGAL